MTRGLAQLTTEAELNATPLLRRPPIRVAVPSVTVEIGATPILLQPSRPEFSDLLEDRYANFLNPRATARYHFDIHLDLKGSVADEDAKVVRQGSLWSFRRGDFQAQWDVRRGRGWIRQCPNPYAIDTVLRITHSLILAEQGGFLVHAASAIRGDQAFLFAGVSGVGKTTMARLAPPDAIVLTDEISYVRKVGPDASGYRAYGTPFAGELAHSGANASAPLRRLFLLKQGPENRIEPVSPSDAARSLMRHILFFAQDHELVARVFDSVLEFVSKVEVWRLVFTPDARAWEPIR